MNVFAKKKEDFIKYGNVKELFRELYNVCLLFKNESCFYYCYCSKMKSMKCNLCQFNQSLFDGSVEKFLLTYRNDQPMLMKVVNQYWLFVCDIKKKDQDALDFLNKTYIWKFKDYQRGEELSMDIDEIIKNNEELIKRNGLKNFIKFLT